MIRNTKTFAIGIVMLISFALVYVGMMSPSFGNGRNGLEYADDMFNSLSKGSAYFIKDQVKVADAQKGVEIDVDIKASTPAEAEKWSKLYSEAGSNVKINESTLTITGDLGKILNSALADSESMYNNEGKILETKYGYEAREATYNWYVTFKKIDIALKNKQMFKEATALGKLQQKAIEPAYNYYGIEIKHVRDNKAGLTFMLIFYLIYTLWYGFALFYLCDGFGITVSKKKVAA